MNAVGEVQRNITLSSLHADRVPRDPNLGPRDLDRMVFERGFPITDEEVTTFAYRGDVDAVHLVHFGLGLPYDLSFERLPDSNWFVLPLRLPAGTRLEYKLHITQGSHRYDAPDPLNPFEARNPFGHNSVCRSAGYVVPPWAQRDPAAKEGLQRSLTVPSRHLGRPVDVHLHLPADFSMKDKDGYPLIVMHDGLDYLHYADAGTVVDNLIHQGLLPDCVIAFCEPRDRLVEYGNDERHANFIGQELVPYLDGHLPLISDRASRCLVGASFGAVATLATTTRYPDMFAKVLLQSGSFDGAAHDGADRTDELWWPVTRFVSDFVESPIKIADQVFMSCGTFEALIVENRAMRSVLADTESRVLLGEYLDGHTWGCWRDSLGDGLAWLFKPDIGGSI